MPIVRLVLSLAAALCADAVALTRVEHTHASLAAYFARVESLNAVASLGVGAGGSLVLGDYMSAQPLTKMPSTTARSASGRRHRSSRLSLTLEAQTCGFQARIAGRPRAFCTQSSTSGTHAHSSPTPRPLKSDTVHLC